MKINEVTVKRGKTLTYEEIKVFGNNLKIIDDLMNQNFVFASNKFGKSSELCEALKKQEVMISKLRSMLDDRIGGLELQEMPEDADLNEVFYGVRDYSQFQG